MADDGPDRTSQSLQQKILLKYQADSLKVGVGSSRQFAAFIRDLKNISALDPSKTYALEYLLARLPEARDASRIQGETTLTEQKFNREIEGLRKFVLQCLSEGLLDRIRRANLGFDPIEPWDLFRDVRLHMYEPGERDAEHLAVMHEIHTIRQGPIETFEEYQNRMFKMLEQVSVLDKPLPGNPEVRNYWINGIHDHYLEISSRLKERARLNPTLTLQQLATEARQIMRDRKIEYVVVPTGVERGESHRKRINLSGDNGQTMYTNSASQSWKGSGNTKQRCLPQRQGKPGRANGGNQEERKSKNKDVSGIQCWNCEGFGHFSSACPSQPKPQAKTGGSNNPRNNKSGNNTTAYSSSLQSDQAPLYLDTAANVGLTNDIRDLENIKHVKSSFITSNGGSQLTTIEGDHALFGNRTVLLESSRVKIVPFAQAAKAFDTKYDQANDEFILSDPVTKEFRLRAVNRNDIYVMDSDPWPESIPDSSSRAISTIREGSVTIEELHRRLLHTNAKTLEKSVLAGHYQDVLTHKPEAEEYRLLESCLACGRMKDGRIKDQTRGPTYRSTRRKLNDDDDSEDEERHPGPSPQFAIGTKFDVTLHFDTVYVMKQLSLFAVVKPYNFLIHRWLSERSGERSGDRLATTVNMRLTEMEREIMIAGGIRSITSIHADRDPTFTAIKEDLLAELGLVLVQVVANTHNKFVERQVRTTRNRVRCSLDDLQSSGIGIHDDTIRRLWDHIVMASNYIINKSSGDYLPYQLHFGRESYVTPPRFGQFILATADHKRSKMDPVREVGYIIGFDYHHRGVLVQFADRKEPLWRDSYRELTEDQGSRAFQSRVVNPERTVELPSDLVELCTDPLEGPLFVVKKPATNIVNYLESVGWNSASDVMINSLQDEIKVQGEVGARAAEKLEMQTLWKETNCIEPVQRSEITSPDLIVPSKLLTKEKRDAQDKFQRMKSRLVARGDMRSTDPEEIGNTYSPTVSFPTILLTLNLILALKLDYATADFTSAYLNSEFNGNLFMKLNSHVAELMVEIDPEAKNFVQPDKTMFVKIKKGLYGLQESAKLWYETLATELKELGYTCSEYDTALFFKVEGNGIDIILVYVDDMLLAGTRKTIESLRDKLKSKFVVNFSAISPKEFDYVGMHIKHDMQDESFLISQPAMLDKILKDVQGEEELPYDNKLFSISEANSLCAADVTKFRSELMEMSYLTKTRKDITLPIAFLSTRMQQPTEEDSLKLARVKRYLNGTRSLVLRLRPHDLKIRGIADASYGTFPDGKSNSGIIVSMGYPNAPIVAKSTKQKAVANSSSGAELIAFASALEEVLWIKNLLEELGFEMKGIPIEQDNTSTMTLIENGTSSAGRTRWMNVRHFWVKQFIDSGDIKLVHVPSKELLADGLTKPLGKHDFKSWRARILNWKSARKEVDGEGQEHEQLICLLKGNTHV